MTDDSDSSKFIPDESVFEDYAVTDVQCPHCNLTVLLGIHDPEHRIEDEDREIVYILPPGENGLLEDLAQLADKFERKEWRAQAKELRELIAEYGDVNE